MAEQPQSQITEHEAYLQATNQAADPDPADNGGADEQHDDAGQPEAQEPAWFKSLSEEAKQAWLARDQQLEEEKRRAWKLEQQRRAAEGNVAPMQRQNAELKAKLEAQEKQLRELAAKGGLAKWEGYKNQFNEESGAVEEFVKTNIDGIANPLREEVNELRKKTERAEALAAENARYQYKQEQASLLNQWCADKQIPDWQAIVNSQEFKESLDDEDYAKIFGTEDAPGGTLRATDYIKALRLWMADHPPSKSTRRPKPDVDPQPRGRVSTPQGGRSDILNDEHAAYLRANGLA